MTGRARAGLEESMNPEAPSGIAVARVRTPIGTLGVAASPRGLRRVEFDARRVRPSRGTAAAQAQLERAVRQVRQYFAGQRKEFDLPLDLEGTEHQTRVWRALQEIPFGRTLTYGELTHKLGLPRTAARAVGRACATNPVPVVVPCHRVIGGDGKLHGFGGGLWRKQALLELEQSACVRQGHLFKDGPHAAKR
jgi:methylated-DNA-[protein]-cysteine S-methyltransferase